MKLTTIKGLDNYITGIPADRVDMNYYGCECGCDENFRMSQLRECPDCLRYIHKEHDHECE